MPTPMTPFVRPLCCALLLLCLPAASLAQRRLTWQGVAVTATLERDGTLVIEEEQAIVFTGDWNGGERRFNVRPRQRLSFTDLARETDRGWQVLREDADLDDVDEFAWTDRQTLRWRSRMASDPPFDGHVIRYRLRYGLSGILVKDGDRFLLDHDFLFPERDGAIDRFALKLSLDSAWSPEGAIRETYAAENVAPGRGFVVTVPLRYVGAGVPAILDTSRPREIVVATILLLCLSGIALTWLFVREYRLGRFAAVPSGVDEAWLREHILSQPAEIVGAAWDDGIGAAEVVALIARMESEGKLASDVTRKSMTLRLLVDRESLDGYERTIVDKLFVNNRTTTTPAIVKSHYKKKGFNPADEIRKALGARVDAFLTPRGTSKFVGMLTFGLALVGYGMLFADWSAGHGSSVGTPVLAVVVLVLIAAAWGMGNRFRANIQWGLQRAWTTLAPGLVIVGAMAAFLWFYVGPGEVDVTHRAAQGLAALALAVLLASIASMRSRRSHEALARRKTLAAGRAFFIAELAKPLPALRDEWMPWVLAFGLAKHVDDWSAHQASGARVSHGRSSTVTAGGWSGGSAPSGGWSGFGGGRSGGAGAAGSWAAAAGDFAAGVSPESSGGSGGSGGGGGGSSSGGSSGGGGGGGW